MPVRDHLMDHALGFIERVVRIIALWFGGVVLFIMMGLTVVDVIFRDVLNAPIFGAEDLWRVGLLIVVATAVAYSGRTGGQVAVELYSDALGSGITRWTDKLVRLIGAAMFTVLAWRLLINGRDAAIYGETSQGLLLSHGPFYYILAAGMGLYALVLAVEIFAKTGDGEAPPSEEGL